jgi:hypothetical protein
LRDCQTVLVSLAVAANEQQITPTNTNRGPVAPVKPIASLLFTSADVFPV